jgi:hypothetical protein
VTHVHINFSSAFGACEQRDFSEQAFLPSPRFEAGKSTFSNGKSAGVPESFKVQRTCVGWRDARFSRRARMILAQFLVAERS